MNNKSVLVIETPENCYKCPLHRHVNTSKRCMGNMRQYEDHSIVQSWCPLRPLPQELDNISVLPEDPNNWSYVHYEPLGYEEGWNACLEEIMGETE